MWGDLSGKFKYVPSKKTDIEKKNKASLHAKNIFTNSLDRYDAAIIADYKKILNGGCIYLPNFFEKTIERIIFEKLKNELEENKSECDRVQWSKHFKYENPKFLPTFNAIVDEMAEYFNVKICQTRLNYYKDNTSWKPFHKDSHRKYNGIKENFTMGASFGDTRALEFKHDGSNKKFRFPQNNGDIFAFNSKINSKFMHGVPRTRKIVGPRFSIIAWGVRSEVNK